MPTTWIIAANAGRVRFFAEADSKEPLQELEDMVSPAAQLRTEDTETDKLSPTAASGTRHNIGGNEGAGMAHNAKAGAPNKLYQPAQTPDQHAADLFAKDVAEYLLKAHNEGRYQQLVLAASPEFLGVLRTKLNPAVQGAIKTEVNKDYTHSSAQQLREQLQAHAAKSE
ncbi:host attachment protein [Massilia sp. G4R7]|uniref:Host attachment protein n=1 Tax=Massilia phyllostachyos TaxID=2898585 RepID=A0ABS8Q9G6_9BURK|nr:host attachment protein [Massilia phyllostachyos]MCD2517250.1 host attachment protein [Massilia phyllostachyos]